MGRHYKLPVIKYKPRKVSPVYEEIKQMRKDKEFMLLLKNA